MKVVHFAAFSPGRSGQYATVKDLILAERSLGIDAQLVDCLVCNKCNQSFGEPGKTDGEITTVSETEAKTADILVRHSIIPLNIENLNIPMILCLHGRPENSFLLECYGTIPVYTFLNELRTDDRYKAFITFWPEYIYPLSKLIPPEKLYCIPSMVHLDEYSLQGKVHDLGRKSGSPNIIIADMWREDTTPFNVLMAAVKFKEEYCESARIHIFGVPANGPKNKACEILINRLKKSTNALGDVYTLSPNMMDKYRAGDLLVTPHVIATRVVREALACGLPIVAGEGNKYTGWTANPMDMDGFAEKINEAWKYIKHHKLEMSQRCRQITVDNFNPRSSAIEIKKIFEKVLQERATDVISNEIIDGNITFAFSAYGDDYIHNVFVLLQSIDKVYNGKANIIFYYYNISSELINQIKMVLPYVIIKETKVIDCEDGDAEYKTAMKSLIWSEILEDYKEFENIILMDADMLILQKMGRFFMKNFDIGYCYKLPNDENPQWPINAGIMLIKNNKRTRNFIKNWAKLTKYTQKNLLGKSNGYLLWGGGDQVSFGHILGTHKTKDLMSMRVVNNTNLLGFPMKFFNESRCIKPDSNTHVLHYKSESWQNLLRTGEYSPRRPEIVCETMYTIFRDALKEWQHRVVNVIGIAPWSPELELEYWTSHTDSFYIEDMERLFKIFEPKKLIDKFFSNGPDVVVDVGGGMMGGALYLYNGGKRRILFDYLADKYKDMGKVPDDIECIRGDFGKMPFTNNSVDVIFAWEVLDHAQSVNHFIRGQLELCRVLKPGGLLFFNHPIHTIQKHGHTVLRTVDEIKDKFISEGLIPITPIAVIDNELCLVFQKSGSLILNEQTIEKLINDNYEVKLKSDKFGELIITEVKTVSLDKLIVQIDDSSIKHYMSVYTQFSHKCLLLKNTPHYKFLKLYESMRNKDSFYDDIKISQYYKFQILLRDGRDEKVKCKIDQFLDLYSSIKKMGIKLLPIVCQSSNSEYEYEIFDGHHRLVCALFAGIEKIKVGVLSEKPKIKDPVK